MAACPMGTIMTGPGATASDNVPAQCPVPLAIGMAKAIVGSARPSDRYSLWGALSGGIDAARQEARESGSAMPWETREEIGWIAWEDLQSAIADALMGLEEISERRRLVYVAKGAYEDLRAEGGGTTRPLRAGKYGIRVCARPGCGQRFAAKSSRHIWHSSTCRATAHKAARRAAEREAGEVPVT
jgi:hypothetical protein